MRRWWFALVLVTGCYAPSAPAGAPCAENRACPEGLVCELVSGTDVCIVPGTLAPDASVDAVDAPDGNPELDGDGDGVPDEQDVCPEVADDQHDEEHDGIGDACDGCPYAVSTVDSDGDGVHDECDPFPTQAGDEIRSFAGFGGTAFPGTYSAGEGWSVSGDNAVFVGVDESSASLVGPDLLVTPGTIVAWAVRPRELRSGGAVGIGLGAGTGAVFCGLTSASSGSVTATLSVIGMPTVLDSAPFPGPVNQRLFMFLARTASDSFQCSIASEVAGTLIQLGPGTTSMAEELSPFFVGQAADLEVAWFDVQTFPAN